MSDIYGQRFEIGFILIPALLFVLLLVIFIIAFVVYKRKINRRLHEAPGEQVRVRLPAPAEIAVIIGVIAAAVCFILLYTNINTLEKEIDRLSDKVYQQTELIDRLSDTNYKQAELIVRLSDTNYQQKALIDQLSDMVRQLKELVPQLK